MKQMLIESKFDMHKLKKGDLLVVKVPDAYEWQTQCDKHNIDGYEIVGKLKEIKNKSLAQKIIEGADKNV